MVNAEIRKKLGYDTLYPMKGEKVLCLGNNYNYSFDFDDIPIYMINGMQGTVIADTEKEKFANVDVARLNFIPDFIYNSYGASKEHTFSIPCYREIFEQYLKDPSKQAFIETLYEEIDESVTSDICTMDYGYALTCHKSQGSEYDNVLVLVESKIPSNLYNKWLYTAITRAKKSVTVASVC
jgi:exodeoxyribonuclease-5